MVLVPLARFLRRGALLLLGMLGVLGLLELALRASGWLVPFPPLYVGDMEVQASERSDPAIGWKGIAGEEIRDERPERSATYAHNELGFRGPSPLESGAAERIIALLGDSFGYGWGVDYPDCFAARIDRARERCTVLDFAYPGFGIDQMWCTLRRYALPARPDLVVVAFVDDDLNRDLSAYRLQGRWFSKPTFVVRDGVLAPTAPGDRPPGWLRWVEQELLLSEVWRRLEQRVGRTWPVGRHWRLARALFAAMRDDCRGSGVPLACVRIPDRGRWEASASCAAEFRSLGIPFLDLGACTPEDRAALYFARDPHLTPRGHAFAAERILEFLAGEGLLVGEAPAPSSGTAGGR